MYFAYLSRLVTSIVNKKKNDDREKNWVKIYFILNLHNPVPTQ